MKNRLKINAKSIENRPIIDQKCTKNPSWRGLGGPLGALGGQDRKKTKATRTFRASWGSLGAVLATPGPIWDSTWTPKVAQKLSENCSKIDPQKIPNRTLKCPQIGPQMKAPHGGPYAPNGDQNGNPKWGSQMGTQMGIPNRGPKWGSQMGT